MPAGAIVPFVDVCPDGWRELDVAGELLLRGHDGSGDPDEVGGASGHTHGSQHAHALAENSNSSHRHDVALLPGQGSVGASSSSSGVTVVEAGHSHSADDSNYGPSQHDHAAAADTRLKINDTTEQTTLPPFREVVLCEALIDTESVEPAMRMLWTENCGAGWTHDSSYENRILAVHDGDGDLPEDGGSLEPHTHTLTHSHVSTNGGEHSHGGPSFYGIPSSQEASVDGTFRAGRPTEVARRLHGHDVDLEPASHSHPLESSSVTVSAEVASVPYRELEVCAPGPTASFGDSFAVLGLGGCLPGFTEAVEYRGRFLLAEANGRPGSQNGGSDGHAHEVPAHTHSAMSVTHTHDATAAQDDNEQEVSFGGLMVASVDHAHDVFVEAAQSHSHSVAESPLVQTLTAVALPPFQEVFVCERNAS